jgi:signal transduction histidine kinase/CheY-like chemotaxis protein
MTTIETQAAGVHEREALARAATRELQRHAWLRPGAFLAGAALCLPVLQAPATPSAAAWLVVIAGVAGLQLWLALQLHRAPEGLPAAAPWRLATLCAVASGAAWGAGWLLLAPGLDRTGQLVYLVAALLALLPAVPGYAPHQRALQGLCLAALAPPVVGGLAPEPVTAWPVTGALAALLLIALHLSREASRSFGARYADARGKELLLAQLAAERDAAVAANLAKSRFITAASHDLRQPMHALSIQLESLDIPGIPASARDPLTRIRNSVGNLNQMFESLLDISRLDTAGYRAGERMFRLPDFAAGLSEVAAPLAARKGVAFRVEGLEGAVCGDEKLLRQVLLNLLANALAYTPQGEVSLRLRDDQGCLVLEVGDTGCGIAEEDQVRIFTEFFRADRTRVQHEGLGLGLSIVRRVCDLIGAQVEVTSHLGRGSTFTVRTPYRLQHAPAAFPGGLGTPVPAIPSLHGKWIAVIEDDPNIVEAYRDAFARRGANVVVLPEKIDALDRELAQLAQLDLIVSDYRLRDTTGDLLIERLRESFNEDIPAVVVTADTAPEHADRFRKMGVELLHKPLSFRTLLATAEALLLRGPAREAPASAQ